jgi:hypothetical protein
MVNEFIELQRTLIDESSAVLARLDSASIGNPEGIISGEMKAKGEKAQHLFEAIVMQMRKELGVRDT